jgi:hypothetical protein
MPIHDWTRVSDGTFHDFHSTWIPKIKNNLNRGILPAGFYAMAEQVAGSVEPDVLTLQHVEDYPHEGGDSAAGGTIVASATAVSVAKPKLSVEARLERSRYAQKANHIVIRHQSSDRVVAIIEIVSAGNKSSQRDFRRFLEKATTAINDGIHVSLVDLHPPTARDPEGIHGAIWSELGDGSYEAPSDKPLTMAAYVGNPSFSAYVEPLAVGDVLPPLPVFLTTDRFVEVPLEESYMAAVSEVPDRARAPLEK